MSNPQALGPIEACKCFDRKGVDRSFFRLVKYCGELPDRPASRVLGEGVEGGNANTHRGGKSLEEAVDHFLRAIADKGAAEPHDLS